MSADNWAICPRCQGIDPEILKRKKAAEQLDSVHLLWKVALADHALNPTTHSVLLLRNCTNIQNALERATKTEGFTHFKKAFPHCVIVGCELAGRLES